MTSASPWSFINVASVTPHKTTGTFSHVDTAVNQSNYYLDTTISLYLHLVYRLHDTSVHACIGLAKTHAYMHILYLTVCECARCYVRACVCMCVTCVCVFQSIIPESLDRLCPGVDLIPSPLSVIDLMTK